MLFLLPRVHPLGRLCFMAGAILAAGLAAAAGADRFPFGQELLLDAKPMRGSKRVPSLEVSQNGAAAIDLWCNSSRGQIVVIGAEITVVPGAMTSQQCSPEQVRNDTDMLTTLSQVTTWRREGDTIVLVGPKTLRFRMQTN